MADIVKVTQDKKGEELILLTSPELILRAGGPMVTAYRSDGSHVGTMSFNYGDGKLLLWRQSVVKKEQRKGIATAMYRRAEERWGKKIAIDELSPLTGMGQDFAESLAEE